ncbi:helix-turn-helix transcriptional regulator [Lachnospiraceae bacterium 54-53]
MEVKIMQNSKVGDIIRTIRLEHGMTQKQLADRMNISDKAVSKWERGVSHS